MEGDFTIGLRRGLMLVLSSPSGAGKTTLSRMLREVEPESELSVSVTTRPPRPGEVEGRDYHFVERPTFEKMVQSDAFLEWAEVFGNLYGTPRAAVEDALLRGHDVLFDIDWQGTQQLRQRARSDLVSIFLLPPDIEELERRLHFRAQDSDEVIRQRMSKAADEMSHWPEYDYVVINNELDAAFRQVHGILTAERMKRERQPELSGFVRDLQMKLRQFKIVK